MLTDYFQTQFVASETPERMALRIADAFEGSTLNFPDSADLDRAEMRAVTDEELTTDPSPENITRIARRFSVARVVITKSFARRGGGVEERRCELALA